MTSQRLSTRSPLTSLKLADAGLFDYNIGFGIFHVWYG